MDIKLRNIKIRDVFNGFTDDGEDGVYAFDGRLTIRPPYQREFVYDAKEQEAVLHTILNGFPLNTMYWVLTNGSYSINDEDELVLSDDAKFEVLDGQQRTLSVMYFLKHKLQIKWNGKSYYEDSLPDDLYNALLDYSFMIYICEGTDSEKLAWFEVVNVAGEELSPQELRNSVYTGPWLSAAKKIFSKSNCPAKGLSEKYIKADYIRQGLLEKALKGICEKQNLKDITEYMAAHVKDNDADELWQYFQDAINWVKKIFPDYNSDMKGLDWLHFYNKYGENKYNTNSMKEDVKKLHIDKEIGDYKGIYEFLLSRGSDPYAGRLLQLRTFDEDDKLLKYNEQKGICTKCGKHFEFSEMEGDHIKPWSKGGKTEYSNLQMLCKDCNAHKTDIY